MNFMCVDGGLSGAGAGRSVRRAGREDSDHVTDKPVTVGGPGWARVPRRRPAPSHDSDVADAVTTPAHVRDQDLAGAT